MESQDGNPFSGNVDLKRIALMGIPAAERRPPRPWPSTGMKYYPEDANIRFNYGYALQAVVAIAPADGQYQPADQPRWIEDVSYLRCRARMMRTSQRSQAAARPSVCGRRDPVPGSAARFGRTAPITDSSIRAGVCADFPPPLRWFLNLAPLMPGEEQRRISKTYIAAFLETALRDRREYLPLFRDWRTGREWLPETIYINRIETRRMSLWRRSRKTRASHQRPRRAAPSPART